MVIIVVAMLVIVAVVAIVMFFLILGARGIIVILFTAISPLALACNILPNTQNLFKKWWSIFKTALIVYPICGALYGISFIIRAIVLKNGENGHLAMAMAAVIAPYLPFLVLPTLTKGALAGLGAVSGALTGLGNGIKSGIGKGQNALQHTEAYKNAQELASRNKAIRLGGLKRNKKTGELEVRSGKKYNGDNISARMGRYRKMAMANEIARIEEENMTGASLESGMSNIKDVYTSQLEKNAASALSFGNAKLNDGTAVQVGNSKHLKTYHGEALARYKAATTQKGKDEALAQIKAVQRIMSKTDAGRGNVISSLKEAISNGNDGEGLQQAAIHLQGEFGDLYKIKNRGGNALLGALAGGNGTVDKNMLDSFAMARADAYSEETLVGADEEALKGMADALESYDKNGTIIPGSDAESYEKVRETAKKALAMNEAHMLSIKGEALKDLRRIAGVPIGSTSKSSSEKIPETTIELRGSDGGGSGKTLITGASNEELSRAKLEVDRQNQGNRNYPGNGIKL